MTHMRKILKLRWRVQPNPSSTTRGLKRGWPVAHDDNSRTMAMITCNEPYHISLNNTPLLLCVMVVDRSRQNGDFEWVKLPCTNVTLAEAKVVAEKWFEDHPEALPR